MTDLSVSRISRHFYARDGLRLHFLEYGLRTAPATPVVCLPGLTRTAEDFDRLARAIAGAASAPRRRVVAVDYRGRGGSDWDPDWSHYNLAVEQEDILATLAAAEVTEAIFVGTSRGGLHIMLLAAARPQLLRGAVINDIGPQIEPAGLLRIKSYIGKLPPLTSWSEAIDFLRHNACLHFTSVPAEDWDAYARQTFAEEGGRFRLRYDPALARTLDAFTPESPPPEPLWPQFEALAGIPVLGLRGEHSDLLSSETFAEMGRRHPAFQSLVVEGQGHPPLLLDAPTISAIANFVARLP
ncbi:MAG TPA: alpha/beta hydrolase [Xanthobacteraceae bacterium]|nr:alpha/beta hydrolase [Xanthobacteraceae bacterium]